MSRTSRNRIPDRAIIVPAARRDTVLDLIHHAKSRITLSLFRCNDKSMLGELQAAVARGVNVEVVVTSRAKGGKKKLRKLWSRLEDTGASVYAYTDPVVKYHAKYLVVDDGPALITSMNFTKKCCGNTCDVVVLTHDPAVVNGLRELMTADRAGGSAPTTLPDRLIVGPERARRQFTALIEQAQSRIQLIDAKLSDPGLIALLNQRRAQGIVIEVHDQKQLGPYRTHGKIMLIDGKRAVVGSVALAAISLDFRREVALSFDDPGAVAEIELLFRSIRTDADATGVPEVIVGGV